MLCMLVVALPEDLLWKKLFKVRLIYRTNIGYLVLLVKSVSVVNLREEMEALSSDPQQSTCTFKSYENLDKTCDVVQ